jgi:hypothetical protein
MKNSCPRTVLLAALILGSAQTAIATSHHHLSAADIRIAALSTHVNQLTATNAVLITQQNQELGGFDEILLLLQLPADRRTSTLVSPARKNEG